MLKLFKNEDEYFVSFQGKQFSLTVKAEDERIARELFNCLLKPQKLAYVSDTTTTDLINGGVTQGGIVLLTDENNDIDFYPIKNLSTDNGDTWLLEEAIKLSELEPINWSYVE